MSALALAPLAVWLNSQFFRPITNGRIVIPQIGNLLDFACFFAFRSFSVGIFPSTEE